MITEQIGQSEKYSEIKQVISIVITEDRLDDALEKMQMDYEDRLDDVLEKMQVEKDARIAELEAQLAELTTASST